MGWNWGPHYFIILVILHNYCKQCQCHACEPTRVMPRGAVISINSHCIPERSHTWHWGRCMGRSLSILLDLQLFHGWAIWCMAQSLQWGMGCRKIATYSPTQVIGKQPIYVYHHLPSILNKEGGPRVHHAMFQWKAPLVHTIWQWQLPILYHTSINSELHAVQIFMRRNSTRAILNFSQGLVFSA